MYFNACHNLDKLLRPRGHHAVNVWVINQFSMCVAFVTAAQKGCFTLFWWLVTGGNVRFSSSGERVNGERQRNNWWRRTRGFRGLYGVGAVPAVESVGGPQGKITRLDRMDAKQAVVPDRFLAYEAANTGSASHSRPRAVSSTLGLCPVDFPSRCC